jgi:branched-chain amino acid transport system ATP-binding protein
VRRGLTLCPEGRRLFQHLTVDENLRIGAYSQRAADEMGADREWLLDTFPVLRDRLGQLAGSLSGGQQQQLAIARALMSRPSVLLLDEPSLGLAPQMVEAVFETIEMLRAARGVTILLVEQNAELALEIADRAYVINVGQIRLSGDAGDLLQSSGLERAYMGLSGVA